MKSIEFPLPVYLTLKRIFYQFTNQPGFIIKENSFHISRILLGSIDGHDVFRFRLHNGEMSADIMNYGGTITAIYIPDRFGIKKNVVAGFDNLQQYTEEHPYLGCTIGRFANRIAFGKCFIEGSEYSLALNDPPNHLHGGFQGFNRKIWQVQNMFEENSRAGVSMSYESKDGEEGYPGNLKTIVTFSLTGENKLHIHYEARTDKPTIINLTNHSYFNLTAFEEEHIYNHQLKIFADQFLLKNEHQIPTGEIVSVRENAFDFTKAKKIGEYINQVPNEAGFDHTFVLHKDDDQVVPAAELLVPASGRILKVFTDQPAIHLYTANWWNGALQNSDGKHFCKHGAIAFEAQGFPDAPNHSNFPKTTLMPGATYEANTVFQFLVET